MWEATSRRGRGGRVRWVWTRTGWRDWGQPLGMEGQGRPAVLHADPTEGGIGTSVGGGQDLPSPGRLSNRAHFKGVECAVFDDGVAQGSRILCGGCAGGGGCWHKASVSRGGGVSAPPKRALSTDTLRDPRRARRYPGPPDCRTIALGPHPHPFWEGFIDPPPENPCGNPHLPVPAGALHATGVWAFRRTTAMREPKPWHRHTDTQTQQTEPAF